MIHFLIWSVYNWFSNLILELFSNTIKINVSMYVSSAFYHIVIFFYTFVLSFQFILDVSSLIYLILAITRLYKVSNINVQFIW